MVRRSTSRSSTITIGDKAKIDGIHFQVIKDMETAYKEFQAGNLDVCDVPVAQIDAAKKDRGVSQGRLHHG